MADTSQVREITLKLEQGVKDLFTSERYANYLRTMSRFHRYSTRNTLLIHMQNPNASLVCGFLAWQKKFGRHVKKGEKAIKILAPTPFTIREEKEKLDPDTCQPIIGDDGLPIVEQIERHLARFKVTSVFDVLQTDGKPLPTLVQNLSGDVEQYKAFIDALRTVSPLPIVFEAMPEDTDGVCRFGIEIAIRSGMSEIQTVSAIIHELTHAKLHDLSNTVDDDGDAKPRDRRTEEITAESVSYSVCQYFGIETGENSFGYLLEWSKTRDLKELNASLDTIRRTAAELIDAIDDKYREIVKDRDVTIAVGESQDEVDTPAAAEQAPAPALETDDEDEENGASIERKNYQKLEELFPQVANGEYSYLRLEAGDGFMPLTLEWHSNSLISIMHTYTNNGDLCYDPTIAFRIGYEHEGGHEVKTLEAVEYEQSAPPLYQVAEADGRWLSVDGDDNEKYIWGLQQSINEFAAQWLDNISHQGYTPVTANTEINGIKRQITFDVDGNPVAPVYEMNSYPSEPELIMPDPAVGYSEMNLYGYDSDELLPLAQSRAVELFDADHTVYLLYPDQTEAIVFERDEIMNHDGIFGIERTEWEASLEHAAMKAETRTSEGIREAELLYGNGNSFGIYQVRDVPGLRNQLFAPFDETQLLEMDVVRNNYELVYTAPLSERIESLMDRTRALNNIYAKFNEEHPDGYTGRSVSVSDVIVLKNDGYVSSHYVDRIGFVEINAFLGEEKPQLPEKKPTQHIEETKAERNSQVGNMPAVNVPAASKGKPSLLERLSANKQKAARQGQPDANKTKEREVAV